MFTSGCLKCQLEFKMDEDAALNAFTLEHTYTHTHTNPHTQTHTHKLTHRPLSCKGLQAVCSVPVKTQLGSDREDRGPTDTLTVYHIPPDGCPFRDLTENVSESLLIALTFKMYRHQTKEQIRPIIRPMLSTDILRLLTGGLPGYRAGL